MNKKIALFLIMLISAAAFAQDLPRIAVYVTGDVSENEKTALGTRMLASFVNSGRYRGIERSGAFLAEIQREQTTQRSGAIDDSQISELGKQFGVRFVCIAAITPAFGSFQVSARIVDVETAEVVFIGEAFSPLSSAADLTQVSDEVVKVMFREQTVVKPEPIIEPAPEEPKPNLEPVHKPEPKPEPQQITRPSEPIPATPTPAPKLEPKPVAQPTAPQKSSPKPATRLAIGLDIAGAGIIAYGIYENGNAADHIEKREYSKAESSIKTRNTAYAIGAAVLLGGISIHIFF
jgi:hypothetical protein